jgi:hypothetical protein
MPPSLSEYSTKAANPSRCPAYGESSATQRARPVVHSRETSTGSNAPNTANYLHFPNQPEIEADVRRFTIDDKGCCGF